MFCFRCGANVLDTAAQCPICGTSLRAAAPPPAAVYAPLAYAVPVVLAPPTQTESKAVISLVAGILAILGLTIVAGIPAVILGNMARTSIRNSSGRLTGDGMALTGLILGWVSLGLFVAGIAIVIFILAAGAALSH